MNEPLFACAFAAFTAGLPAQRVWVVGPIPQPDVDFSTIQEAVDAAADGDVVLVRQGTYARFGIQAKALVVVGEGQVQLTPTAGVLGLEIRDLAPGQAVVVRGVSMSSTSSTPLQILNCLGPVTIEASGFFASPVSPFFGGASIIGASHVSLIDCDMWSSLGLRGPTGGLSVSGSTVHMYRCRVKGGSAGSFPGASGAGFYQSFVHANHCRFEGGNGQPGTNIGGFCVPPTDGGHAVVLESASTLHHLNCQFVPGQPGQPGQGCPPANPGLPIAGNGTALLMLGPEHAFHAPGLVRAGQAASLDFRGPAGFGVWLGLAPAQSPVFLAGCRGTSHLDTSSSVAVFLGTMPGSGQLVVNVPVPPRLGVLGIELFLQAVFTDATAGCVLGSPSAMLVVDSRY